ncbi:hypothetical protein BTVI_106058 [Pitangus sulphuratus]|nr:hypothetical protein BTVI_106058 [Pitangus sulphuratus]
MSHLSSHLLQALAAATTLIEALLARSIIQPGLKQRHQINRATAKEMLEHEMFPHQDLFNLLQGIESSNGAKKATILSVWVFGITAAALILLAVVCLAGWTGTPQLARRSKLQESPQLLTVCCPDLPADISEVKISLSVYEGDGPHATPCTRICKPTS